MALVSAIVGVEKEKFKTIKFLLFLEMLIIPFPNESVEPRVRKQQEQLDGSFCLLLFFFSLSLKP